jgi:PKD repeat protein
MISPRVAGQVTSTAASFDYAPKLASIIVSDTVYFTGTSTTNVLPIVGWLWTFDGGAGYGRIRAHTFAVYGLFTVTVTGTNACTTPGATGS